MEIATQVAAGLAAVHEQNLVHRDIKPTNIMVRLKEERSVTAKIIDLGLAKTLVESASEAGISMPGAFAGTPEFASPEQFAGDGVDIRSDLYSLGVTLWEMLIGRTPFRGSSAEVMYQHQHAPLPVEQLSGIPQPLVVLLEVLLAKDPVRRFQTPAELLKVMPTVRDAINAGRAMMKTIRVFVSSTGDVQKERHVAERVMRAIAAEFNLPVSDSYSIFQRLAEENGEPENGEPKTEPDNHSPLVLCPYFLEHQRLQLDAGYLGVMPNTAEFDLVICILWSRLGSPVGPDLKDAGWKRARLGNGLRNWLGVGPRRQEQGRAAVARLSQLFEADAAVGTERGARSLWLGNGTPSRSSLRVGKRTARGTSPGFSTSIATCRSLKSSSGGISAIFYWVR